MSNQGTGGQIRSRVWQSSLRRAPPERPADHVEHGQEHDRSARRDEQAPEVEPGHASRAEDVEQEAAEQRTEDTDDDVAEDASTSVVDDLAPEEARDEAQEQPGD